MSRERELLERAYYVLGELSYAMLKDSGEYNLAGDIYEFLSTPEPTHDEGPVAWMHLDGDSTCTDNTKKYGAVDKLYCIPLYLHPEAKNPSEAEPVAYLYDLDAYCDHRPEQDVLARKIPKGIPSEYLKNVRPLFLHPAPRKPFVRLSEEDIDRELIKNDYYSRSFTAGVRFAEKHHGIGGEG